jgi:hypothetical protein
MSRPLAFVLALALLITGGVMHGLYAERWEKTTALEDAVASLERVPHEFDGWVGKDQPTEDKEYAQAGARGFWARSYTKESKEFLAILMAGRAGRMSVHTPEVCYRGAGFDLYGIPSLYTARSQEAAPLGVFWSAMFVKPAAVNTELQLSWAWSDGSLWSAPANARWTFAGRPALYKLYLSQQVTGLGSDTAGKNRDEFLRAFLPALNQALGVK